MMHKILLVGCGQLGSRHLQALASLSFVEKICVIDPSEESLARGKARLAEMSDINPSITFEWYTNLDPRVAEGDLCIIATQARGRGILLKEITTQFGYERFLIEKIATQSIEEYHDLMDFCNERKLSVWVNCKTRAYGIHQYIKSKLDPQGSIIFSAIAGNQGLANNGIHEADLFTFYDQASHIKMVGSRIDPVLHPSKRGKDIFDLSGSLYGATDKGSDAIISFSGRNTSPDHVSVLSRTGRFFVDHFQKLALESYAETDWKWQPVPIDENWSVSFMTKAFVTDILSKGTCKLPTLEECFPAHEFILNALLPHLNRFLNVNNDFCPVT